MTVAAEHDRVRHLLDQIETIEEVAATLDQEDERRDQLLRIAAEAVASLPPLRAGVVAALLGLSEPTVRTWTAEGVFQVAETESPRLHLEPKRVHEVLHLVRDLREAGKTRGLLDAVWQRLTDRALLDREDLIESIDQLRHGQGREITAEELRS